MTHPLTQSPERASIALHLPALALGALLWTPLARAQDTAAEAATGAATDVPEQPEDKQAAQGPEPDALPLTPPSEAVRHYQRGRDFYLGGRYREAIYELQAALALDPASPELTYNVARIYELLGDIDSALRYYARSRALLPTTSIEERARTTVTIERLEGARRHEAVAPETSRGVADGVFWSVASVSLGALGAGAATGSLALRANNRARGFVLGADGSLDQRQHEVDQTFRLALTSDILLASGVTLSVAAALLYALREKPTSPTQAAQLGASVGSNTAVVTFRGTL